MNQQAKDALQRFTMAAQSIIYDADRMSQFLKMMETPEGAVSAVHTVMVALEQKKPIPPQIAVLLAINIYTAMVDVAQEATGRKGSPQKMQAVMGMLAKGMAFQPGQTDQTQLGQGVAA
jgi:hypothetical protein